MATGLSIDIANLQYQRECDFNDILQKLEETKEEAVFFIKKYVFLLGEIFSKSITGHIVKQYHFDNNRTLTADSYDCFYSYGNEEKNINDMSLNEILDIARELQINK